MKVLVSNSADKLPEITLTLSGDPATLDRVCALLYMIERATVVGHSGTFAVDVDGDGADRILVKGLPKERLKTYKEIADAASSYGGDVEIAGNDSASVTTKSGRKSVYPPEE